MCTANWKASCIGKLSQVQPCQGGFELQLVLQPEPTAALAPSKELSPALCNLWKLGNGNRKAHVHCEAQESQGFVSACPPCQK